MKKLAVTILLKKDGMVLLHVLIVVMKMLMLLKMVSVLNAVLRACYKKFSVTVGTIFEACNIPLNKWFMALYLALHIRKVLVPISLQKILELHQKTAWFMIHRLREMMRVKINIKLTGTVEVDEVYIGGRMKNKHKSVRAKYKEYQSSHTYNKTGVMGLAERGKDLKVQVIESNLKDMVKDRVARTQPLLLILYLLIED